MEKNQLLVKQLKRHFGEKHEFTEKFQSFINDINRTYHVFENDRKLLEKVMELSSDELFEAFLKLKKANETLSEEIEKHKRTEEKLIIAKEKAEESERLKTAFVENLSHEIRTPLNAILGFSELITQDNLSAEKRQLFKDNIKKGGETLSKLVDDIIDISIIEAGKFITENKKFKLIEIFKDLTGYFEKELRLSGRNIEMIVDIKEELKNLTVISDQLRLKQVMKNLVGNAFKFTEEGFVKFGFDISGENQLELFVIDTGIGIRKEFQESIFERFRKIDGKTQKLYRGTGLGLSITKSIVELLNGEISLKSEAGKGSEFRIILPLNK